VTIGDDGMPIVATPPVLPPRIESESNWPPAKPEVRRMEPTVTDAAPAPVVHVVYVNRTSPATHVTTERTAKRFKARMLLGAGWMIAGAVSVTIGISTAGERSYSEGRVFAVVGGVLACISGFAIYICTRVAAWWHHG
jgi:hypothetical protein